jgi:hypothetical protein
LIKLLEHLHNSLYIYGAQVVKSSPDLTSPYANDAHI